VANENYKNSLTLKLFQTCMHFFLLLNTKGDFFLQFFFPTMEVNGVQLSGYY